MEGLRKLPFAVACLLILLALGVELASGLLKSAPSDATAFAAKVQNTEAGQRALEGLSQDERNDFLAKMSQAAKSGEPPGVGIKTIGLVDVIAVFTVALIALNLLIPQHLFGKVQGVATLIFSIILIIVSFIVIILLLIRLILMVSLFFSVPFGTIAYLVLWGFFNTSGAEAMLSLTMLLKLAFAVVLVISQQRFLQNRGLVLLILTSLLGNLIVGFLQGIVPFVLVSITDDLAGIVMGILALIWGIVLLVGSIIAVVEAILTR
jgi:hypothetical protein